MNTEREDGAAIRARVKRNAFPFIPLSAGRVCWVGCNEYRALKIFALGGILRLCDVIATQFRLYNLNEDHHFLFLTTKR